MRRIIIPVSVIPTVSPVIIVMAISITVVHVIIMVMVIIAVIRMRIAVVVGIIIMMRIINWINDTPSICPGIVVNLPVMILLIRFGENELSFTSIIVRIHELPASFGKWLL